MVKKRLILGIGILILLLALAGTVSAKNAYGAASADCGYCHVSIVSGDYTLTTDGNYFKDVHKFNGKTVPANASSCLTCHTDLSSFLPLTSVGQSYSKTHRYNETTLAAKMLPEPGCANCHVNAIANNFNLITGTPTYLKSETCKDCHKAKYDKWSNTLHAVMLTPKAKAQAMGLPTPPSTTWDEISYVIVSKFQLVYFNTTGYGLANNDTYETETEEWINYRNGKPYGTCGNCHTTGWNASARDSSLPGFNGTFSEPGIACERCHKPAGNGHQVVVNYSGTQCQECHILSGSHATGWEKGAHAPPPYEIGSSCMFCHSSFDQYKNQNVTKDKATGVSCGVCHNIHDMTDNKYAATLTGNNFNATTWSEIANAKLSFFNATASRAAGTDVFDDLSKINYLYPGIDSSRKDASYGTAPINVTGKPDSEKLCSICHYRHGLEHIAGVNLTHGTYYYGKQAGATCVDCHMNEKSAISTREPMRQHANDPLTPNSCGGATGCHTTSAQNLSKSSHSVIPVINEWEASAHNDKEVGVGKDGYNHFYGRFNTTTGVASSRANSCLKCHSPMDWNPVTPESVTTTIPLTKSFNGITCGVCHNLHDMGDSLAKSKAAFGEAKGYAWYNRDAIVAATNATTGLPSRYKASYALMESTTELCGNCHSNIRYGNTGPGWASATAANPISVHGFPAKDLFVGSWKESGLLKFECKDCHMATKIKASNGSILPDSQKVKGHSFQVKADLLQQNTACSSCHVTGSELGNLSTTIENIQEETHAKWNTTNATVISALNKVKAYSGEKNLSRTQIAQAYWNVRLVYSDESWGVHNPAKVDQLLDEAVVLANSANASLGKAGTSSVQLYAGWNLVSLNATPASTSPASVMSSVSSSLTVVWGLNASTQTWVLYDPARPAGLNTLTKMVKGESYEIRVTNNCVWTV